MSKSIIFRVDGGNVYSIAMGHVYRCLKVADLLREKTDNKNITFVMKNYIEGIRKVEEYEFKVIKMPAEWGIGDEIGFLNNFTKNFSPYLFIADIRNINNGYVESIRANGGYFIYFDDLGGHRLKSNVVINPSIAPSLQQYPSFNTPTKYYIGEKYFVIDRKKFLKPRKRIRKKCKEMLVSFGGADPCNLTCTLLQSIRKASLDIKINVILGPAYSYTDELNRFLQDTKMDITVKRNVENMYAEMMNADIGLVSGGDTCLEMVFTGTPTIVVPSIWYEKEVADYLVKKGAAESINPENGEEKIINKIQDLINDYSKRKSLSMKGEKLIDGRGSERVVDIIKNCLEEKRIEKS